MSETKLNKADAIAVAMQTNKHTNCKMHCSGIKNSNHIGTATYRNSIYIQMNRTLGGKFRTKRNRAYLHAIMNSSARIPQHFISSFLMHHTWCSLSVSIIVFIIFVHISFNLLWLGVHGLIVRFCEYIYISLFILTNACVSMSGKFSEENPPNTFNSIVNHLKHVELSFSFLEIL